MLQRRGSFSSLQAFEGGRPRVVITGPASVPSIVSSESGGGKKGCPSRSESAVARSLSERQTSLLTSAPCPCPLPMPLAHPTHPCPSPSPMTLIHPPTFTHALCPCYSPVLFALTTDLATHRKSTELRAWWTWQQGASLQHRCAGDDVWRRRPCVRSTPGGPHQDGLPPLTSWGHTGWALREGPL